MEAAQWERNRLFIGSEYEVASYGSGEIRHKNPQEDSESDNSILALNTIITHEIKTPVRAIDGYARIFLEDYGGKVDKEGCFLIENIRVICKDTITLIDRLLTYTRITDIEPVKETVNLRQMIRDVFEELNRGYTEKGRKTILNFDEDFPFVLCDSQLIRQVLLNLMSNALKFTRERETPVISVGFYNENGEDVFYIKDNGVGFDMEYSQNLFGMFQRMHTENEFEGNGIGLFIVKRLIQKMNGRVWITGEVGKGACAYFTLPHENILKRF